MQFEGWNSKADCFLVHWMIECCHYWIFRFVCYFIYFMRSFLFRVVFLGFWSKYGTSVKSSTQVVTSCEECHKKAVDRRALVHSAATSGYVKFLLGLCSIQSCKQRFFKVKTLSFFQDRDFSCNIKCFDVSMYIEWLNVVIIEYWLRIFVK